MLDEFDYSVVSLREIEKEDSSSVWVVNRTKPRGVVNLTMPDGMGGTTVVTIPITFIPIDLSTQVSKQNLLASPTFRRLVTSGSVWPIKEDEALSIMASDKAKAEANRIYAFQTRESSLSVQNPEIAKLQEEETGNISGFALNLANTPDLEEDQILTMIRGNDGVLTKDDYKYIAQNSTHARVKEYCATRAI